MSRTEEPIATRHGRASAKRWVRQDPQNWRAHARLGDVEFDRGRAQAARAAYREAWRLNPQDARVRRQLAMLDAMLGGRRRRSALVEVERLIARGALPADALPPIVDYTVAIRVRWLVLLATLCIYGYLGLVLWHSERAAIVPLTWPAAAIGAGAVLALLLLWFGPLLARFTPATRRLLPGLARRDALLAAEVASPLLAIGLLLAVPFLWAAGLATAVVAVTVTALALTVLFGAVLAGVEFGVNGGVRVLVGVLLLPPVTLPLALGAALITSLVRLLRSTPRTDRRAV